MAGDLAMQDGMDIDLVLDDEDEELAQMRATANAMKVVSRYLKADPSYSSNCLTACTSCGRQ